MLIAEKHPFKEVENYFTDSLLYQVSLKTTENPSLEDPNSGNEADAQPESDEEQLWELNSFITSIDKLDYNNTANDEGKLFINRDLDLAYFSALASDSVPSDTSIDINNDLVSIIHALTLLHTTIRSSFTVHERANDAHRAFFKVLAKYCWPKSPSLQF